MNRLTNNVKADLFGGLTAAVTALPLAIAFGVMVSNELGPEWSSVGAIAGLYGAIFTGFFASLFGGTPCQVTGPTGPMTTVLAGIVAALVAKFGTRLEGEQILTLAFMTVVLSGLFQIVLGFMRLGGLVKYIPYPVTAGFMNGIAVIIFLGQRKPFLGMEDGTVDVATTLLGCFTVAVIMLTPKFTKAVPGSLMGLGLGTAAYYLVAKMGPNLALGPVVGEVPTAIPSLKQVGAFLQLPGLPIFSEVIPIVVTSAISLALLGAIDSLLTSVVADTVTKTRHDSNQELIGQGIGNTVAGCFGGFAGAGATIRTLVNVDAGGRGRLSGMFHGFCLLLVVVAIGSVAGKIPNVVLSGILMVTAYGMIDSWSSGLLKKLGSSAQSPREISANLALVLIVTVVTVVVDLMVAVGLGVVLASLYFVAKTSTTVIRGIYSGGSIHSRRVYPHHAQELLEKHGHETLIVELQGPLFFGSADHFTRTIENALKPEVKRVILDFHRVTGIDSSGGRALVLLQETIATSGRNLAAAGFTPEHQSWGFLKDMGVLDDIKEDFIFPDLDRAREWSESIVLAGEGSLDGTYEEHELRSLDLFDDFSDQEFEQLLQALEAVELKAGEHLYRKDDKADCFYLITQGGVHLYDRGQEEEAEVRLGTFGPGAALGEDSMLMSRGRTAHAVVDLDLKAYRLSKENFLKLREQEPLVIAKLLVNIGRELAHRLKFHRDEITALLR